MTNLRALGKSDEPGEDPQDPQDPQLANEAIEEKDQFTYRTLNVGGTEKRFKFLVVDSAKKWHEANSLSSVFELKQPGSDQGIKIPFSGISMKQWEEVEVKYPIPEWTSEEEKKTQSFMDREKLATDNKMIALFEISSGKEIPGSNMEEKRSFVELRSPGDSDALFLYVTEVMCNLTSGRIMDDWNLYSSLSETTLEVTELSGWDDWKPASETKHFFRFQRPFQDYIVEIPMTSISSADKAMIESTCSTPEPPNGPKKFPNGKFDMSGMEPNYNDPSWQQAARSVAQKRAVKLFEACLPFEIPGDTDKDKYNWIALRMPGDVSNTRRFIEEEVAGYKSRYDFFTLSSGQTS
jgi:hypothetical protein